MSSSLSLGLWFIWVNFYKWCKAGIEVHFLQIDVQLFQHHLLKGISLFRWITFAPLCVKTDYICVDSISGFVVLFHWPTFHLQYSFLHFVLFISVWLNFLSIWKGQLIHLSLCKLRNQRLESWDLLNTASQYHRPKT